ncbi:MAG: nitroreductase family protein [Betaproteobacteria bacterium]
MKGSKHIQQLTDGVTVPRRRVVIGMAAVPLALSLGEALGQAGGEVALPPAQTDGGMPLMQALKARRTLRNFAPEELTPQTLSNLLWAAFGVNRPDGHRTAPSARNWQEVDIYVVTYDGTWVYDAKPHALRRIASGDLRPLTGTQGHSRVAPVTLVYVADTRRMTGASEAMRIEFAAADTGFIAQNAYLYCASEGLICVVFAAIDRDRLAQALKLDPAQRIVLAQSVGHRAR